MSTRLVKTAALALGLLIPLGTAGCTSSEAPSAGGGNITLRMWNAVNQMPPGGKPSDFWMQKAVQRFEQQHPNISVKLEKTPDPASPAFQTLLTSSIMSGTTPDLGNLFAGGMLLGAKKGLLPLNQYIDPEMKRTLTAGWDMVSPNFDAGGTHYGVPYGAGNWFFIYYNKKLMAKAGANVALPPKDWASLIDLSQRLKGAGVQPFVLGDKDGFSGIWTQDALLSGALGTSGVVEMSQGKQSLDSPPIRDAYTAYRQLYTNQLANTDALTTSWDQASERFVAGKAAMTIAGGYFDPQVKAMGDNVGIFPIPVLSGAPHPHVLSGGVQNAYVVFKNSAHPREAMELIKALVSEETQVAALKQGFGQMPNTSSFDGAGTELKSVDPLLGDQYVWIRQKGYDLAVAFDNIMPQAINTYWYKTVTATAAGSTSPQEASANLEQQMKQQVPSK